MERGRVRYKGPNTKSPTQRIVTDRVSKVLGKVSQIGPNYH